MTEIVTESVPSAAARLWQGVRRLAASTDPLVETGNWVALTIGSHLPFWPLYVWWSAGREAWPSALLTIILAPVFLLIPWLSRRSGLAARVATPVAGVGNTVFTIWVLGPSSGTALFFAPCAALAALLFRRSERWLMLTLTTLPLIAWYALFFFPLTPVHRYSASASARLVELNAISIVVLISFFGWLQTSTYQRMERR